MSGYSVEDDVRRDVALMVGGCVLVLVGIVAFQDLTSAQTVFSVPGALAIFEGGFLASMTGLGLGMVIAGVILLFYDMADVMKRQHPTGSTRPPPSQELEG